jgi:peptide-methionine (S)-S-oxide reductase
VRTRVGYCGGSKKSPTYHSLGDHTESIEIDYDPAVITYERLLDVFWSGHEPTAASYSRQYAAFVFVRDEEQERVARASAAAVAKRLGAPVLTEIRRFDGDKPTQFWPAEDYHQKYALRAERALMAELRAYYPSETDFRDSTAAARLNGYVAGDGSLSQLQKEIDSLGLSDASRKHLLATVKANPTGFACGAEK